MKAILVTGGAGHVGSNLIEELRKDTNNRIISLDDYSYGRKQDHIEGVEYREGSTEDIDKLVPETPDIVYHLGEYARISPSFEDAREVFKRNIVGTSAVVEFCYSKDVKLVYTASSTKFAVEGDGRNQNPYSFSKATNVDLINNYGKWFGLRYAIVYLNNAYGSREKGIGTYGTVIEKFKRQYLSEKPLTIVGDGTQRRNFTYVKDLVRGIILVGEKGSGDGYYLGHEKSYSVLEIAKAFSGEIKFVEGYVGRTDSGETPQRARDELDWKTTTDVMDYIKKIKEMKE